MLTGVLLVAAGAGLFLTAPAYLELGGPFNRWRADEMRARGLPGIVTRVADLNARWGATITVWLGRGLGVAAIAVGVVLIVRA